MNSGPPPTLRNARTGELTPPGISFCARANSASYLRVCMHPPLCPECPNLHRRRPAPCRRCSWFRPRRNSVHTTQPSVYARLPASPLFSPCHTGTRRTLSMHPQTEVTVIRRTGPKTPEGKARSSANALKHGLTSRHVVLPGENRAEFDALVARLIQEHRAATALEIEMVHHIAGCLWRLDRARKAEAEYFYVNFIADQPTRDMERRFALILRYATAIERELHRAIARLQQLQKERSKTPQNKPEIEDRPSPAEFVLQNRAAQSASAGPTAEDGLLNTHETAAAYPPDARAS